MRVIGLDYGTKTVGVALSDALGITAQPVETITRKEENKLRKTYARIEEIISQNDVDRIVVGLPKNMNNTVGERAEACKNWTWSCYVGWASYNCFSRKGTYGKWRKTWEQESSYRSDSCGVHITGISW